MLGSMGVVWEGWRSNLTQRARRAQRNRRGEGGRCPVLILTSGTRWRDMVSLYGQSWPRARPVVKGEAKGEAKGVLPRD